jgi:hypothetical protein
MRPAAVLTLLILLLVPISGVAQPPICPPDFAGYAPSRLNGGGQGVVLPGSPNRVRAEPNVSGAIVTQMPEGTEFDILGPRSCDNGIVWVQIRVDGIVGWTAEAVDGAYYLEPINIPPPPSLPGVPPLPAAPPPPPKVILGSGAVHMSFTGAESLLIAVTSQTGAADLWDMSNGVGFPLSMAPQDAPIIFYAENLQPNGMGGDTIVTGDIAGRVFLWDPFFMTYTEQPITTSLLPTFFPTYAVSPSSDFDYIAIGGCYAATNTAGCTLGGASVYDISDVQESRTVEPLFEVATHAAEVRAMDINPANTTLVTAGADGVLTLWSLPDGERLRDIRVIDAPLTDVDFAPDGSLAVSFCEAAEGPLCGVGGVAAYNSNGVELWRVLAHDGEVNTVDFDPTGTRLASGGMDGVVRVWNVGDGSLRQTIAPSDYGDIADVRFFELTPEIAIAGTAEIGIFSVE